MLQAALHTILQKLTELSPQIVELSSNEGITPQHFEKLETVAKSRLPASFKELYKTYSGIDIAGKLGAFFYGISFSSIANIIADFEFRANQSKDISLISLKTFDSQIDRANLYDLLL